MVIHINGKFLYVISLVPPRVSLSRTSRFITAPSELTVAVFKITCVCGWYGGEIGTKMSSAQLLRHWTIVQPLPFFK